MAKYPDFTAGQGEAVINRFGGMKGLARFLRGEMVVVERGKEKEPLPPVPTFSLTTTFFAKPLPKVLDVGENFKAWAPEMSQEPAPPEELKFQRLARDMTGYELVELAGGAEKAVILAEIWRLMERQPCGEKGDLLTNGYTNLFVVRRTPRDGTSLLCVVGVCWRGGGWDVGAGELLHRWPADRRLFSRN